MKYSFLTLLFSFVLIFSFSYMSVGTTTAYSDNNECNNMGCIDIFCDDDDNCFDACTFMSDDNLLRCTSAAVGECRTHFCDGANPIPDDEIEP